jgi:acylphosphatase
MEKEKDQRLHAIVEGHVQGVGFRYYVMERAQELDLTGWVRNTFDGEVEVTAEGPFERLQVLLMRLHSGPRSAFVTDVRTDWSDATGEFYGFNVRSTV